MPVYSQCVGLVLEQMFTRATRNSRNQVVAQEVPAPHQKPNVDDISFIDVGFLKGWSNMNLNDQEVNAFDDGNNQ